MSAESRNPRPAEPSATAGGAGRIDRLARVQPGPARPADCDLAAQVGLPERSGAGIATAPIE